MTKKKRGRIDISPETMLRPRIDRLWADDALLHKDEAAIAGDLDALARDVSPELFVKTMLLAYQAASEAGRAKLDGVLPRWLARSGHADLLKELAADQSLGPDSRPLALTWLEVAGLDTDDLKREPSLFIQALYLDNRGPLGDKSQAYVVVFWYTSPRQNRALGLGFLLDYNPPWDGSVKDVIVLPRRSPRGLIRYVRKHWDRTGRLLEDISPERAKTVILTALKCNREAEIRLPRDLIAARDLFERGVLSLPDGPDPPEFMMIEFDFLSSQGEQPEEIMRFEQTVGRRIRMEDGQELLVMRSFDDMDDEW